MKFVAIIILFTLLAFPLLSKSVKITLGTVDMVPLIIFHPLMDTYVPSRGLFLNVKTKDISKLTIEQKRELVSNLNKKWIEQANKARAKIQFLQKKIKEAEHKKIALLKATQIQIESIKKMKGKIKYSQLQQKIKDAEYNLWNNTKELTAFIKEKGLEYKKLKEKVVKTFYLQGNEHTMRINKIAEDIQEGIRSAVKKYRLVFVLNNSFSLNPKRLFAKKNNLYQELLDIRSNTSKYNIFGNTSVGNFISGDYSNKTFLENEYEDRYNNAEKFLGLFSGSNIFRNSVLSGGKDITGYVLLYIMKKNKVNISKQKQILKIFKKFYNK